MLEGMCRGVRGFGAGLGLRVFWVWASGFRVWVSGFFGFGSQGFGFVSHLLPPVGGDASTYSGLCSCPQYLASRRQKPARRNIKT